MTETIEILVIVLLSLFSIATAIAIAWFCTTWRQIKGEMKRMEERRKEREKEFEKEWRSWGGLKQ